MNCTNFRHQCITEYMRITKHVVMQLQIHPISYSVDNKTASSQNWFQDRHLQEVVQLIKTPLFEWIEQILPDKPKKNEEPKIISGNTLRLVYMFKRNLPRNYFLTMNADPDDEDYSNKRYQHFYLKTEKVIVYVCHKEKGFSVLLNAVPNSGRLSASQTVNISNYFIKPSQNHTQHAQGEPVNSEAVNATKESTKKENLKNIVTRVKRLRYKKKRYPKSSPKTNASVKEITEQTGLSEFAASAPRLRNDKESTVPQVANNSLKEATSLVNSSDASLKNKDILDTRGFTNGDNSDGSTSSGENLPYYGISAKNSFSEDFDNFPGALESGLDVETTTYSTLGSSSKSPIFPNNVSSAKSDVLPDKKHTESKINGKSDKFRTQELKDFCSLKSKLLDDNTNLDMTTLSVENLTNCQIMQLVKKNERYLRKIFQGKRPSWRHEMYKNGGTERLRLNYMCGFGQLSPRQLDAIMEGLFDIFCKEHLKYEDYVSKVMLAEVIIKIHMDICHITMEEAETMLEKL